MLNNDYKETSLGMLPYDWNVSSIGDIARTTSGGTPSRDRLDYYIGDIPWVKSGELKDSIITKTEEHINESAISESNAKLFPKRTLLVAMYGATAGKVGILDIDATTNQAVCAVFPNEEAIPEYLFYALMYRRKELLEERYGGAQPNISQRVLRAFQIPLPPLPEQHAIAHMLTTVRQSIEATERVIAAARMLKRSLMKYLFTYGPVPIDQADQVQLKETEIGYIPSHWELAKLGDIALFKNGINFQANQKGKGILTVDVLNMYSENQYVKLQNLYRVDITPREDYILRKGDLLFVRSSLKQEGVGWPALFPEYIEPVTYCGFIIRARFSTDVVIPEYLIEYLRLPNIRQKLVAKSGKVAITNINQGNLGSLIIPISPISEQRMIADISSMLISKDNLETNHKLSLGTLFQSLLNQLMTGKVRVEDIPNEIRN
jgi:type I restriction enzyme S subunit